MYPWQWHNMKQKYSYARSVINLLTNEKYYEFTLTGQFEDVHGVRADLQWKNLNRKRGVAKWEPALEYDLPEEDPERVFANAPKVQRKLEKARFLSVFVTDDHARPLRLPFTLSGVFSFSYVTSLIRIGYPQT